MNEILNEPMKESRFKALPQYILLFAIVLAPIFFIPANWSPFVFNKLYFLGVLSLAAFLIVAVRALLLRKISPIVHPLLIALWSIAGVYAITALLGPTPKLSLLGVRLEVDTFVFMAFAAFLATLVAHLLTTRQHLGKLLQWSAIAFTAIGLFVAARLIFGASFLSFGLFTDLTSNPFGGWNDLALLSGLSAILCLNYLRVGALSLTRKILTLLGLVASLIFLVLTNYFIALLIVSIVAAGFFLLELLASVRMRSVTPLVRFFALTAIVASIITGVFAFESGIGGKISTAVGISQIEARPAWSTTIDIGKSVLADRPLFGSGPNTFVGEWLKYKPLVVNTTPFWNIDFTQGVGTIPTALITTGALGILAFTIFLLLLVLAIIQFFTRVGGRESFFASTFALASLYLITFTIVYTPSPILVLLAFASVGLFIGALIAEGYLEKREIALEGATWRNYLLQLSLAVGVIIAVVIFIFVSGRYGASLFAGKAIAQLQAGDIAGATANSASALSFAHVDEYERLASAASLTNLSTIVAKASPTDTERNTAQAELTSAIAHASTAVRYNGANYLNWLSLAQVYVAVLPLQVPGAYDNAKIALTRAIELSPKNPDLELTLARLELSNNKATEGREHLTQSLSLKSDYTAALYLLAQLNVAENKVPEAISALIAMQQILPNEPTIYFMLGYLFYVSNNDTNAVQVLTRAVELSNDYANARYFLGLALARTGKRADAIAQFEAVAKTNPDNTDVASILANLKAGKDPFANSKTTRPEKSSTPPISGE